MLSYPSELVVFFYTALRQYVDSAFLFFDTLFLLILPDLVSVCSLTKHSDQKKAGEESVHLAYTSGSQPITKRIQGRNSNRSSDRDHEGTLRTCSLVGSLTSSPPSDMSTSPSWLRQILSWGIFSQMTLAVSSWPTLAGTPTFPSQTQAFRAHSPNLNFKSK